MEESSGGLGLCSVLFIVFLVLKLCNVIDWSWWWVTAPLWIPIALGFGITILILSIIIVGCLCSKAFRDYIKSKTK